MTLASSPLQFLTNSSNSCIVPSVSSTCVTRQSHNLPSTSLGKVKPISLLLMTWSNSAYTRLHSLPRDWSSLSRLLITVSVVLVFRSSFEREVPSFPCSFAQHKDGRGCAGQSNRHRWYRSVCPRLSELNGSGSFTSSCVTSPNHTAQSIR